VEGISFSWTQEQKLHLPATAAVTPRYASPAPTRSSR